MQAILLLETKKSECQTIQYTFTHHLLLSSKFITVLRVKTLYGSCLNLFKIRSDVTTYDVRVHLWYVVKKFLVVEYMIARHYNTWVILRSMHVQKCATQLRGLFCLNHELTIFTYFLIWASCPLSKKEAVVSIQRRTATFDWKRKNSNLQR